MSSTHLDFDSHDLAQRLEQLSDQERHSQPFGVIGLSADGKVRFFSETEARSSGRGDEPTLGLYFFRHVAPCMNTHTVRGRIDAALAEGTLDLELGHTGDLTDPTRFIRLRAMSSSDGGVWLALEREPAQRSATA
jgi:photoactive yellow protein